MSVTNSSEGATKCARCGEPIVQATKGRRRRYCSDTCRRTAQRLRREAWAWISEEEPQRATVAGDRLPGLEAGVPAPERSDIEAVARAILAASMLVAELRRHAIAAPPRIAGKCGALADALDAALVESFGEVFT